MGGKWGSIGGRYWSRCAGGGAVAGGAGGTLVLPGAGTIGGGIAGAGLGGSLGSAGGAALGGLVGAAGGAIGGALLGKLFCPETQSSKDRCDSMGKPIPMAPPLPRDSPCPPCPSPPTPRIDRVPPSRPHYTCPGDHWHYFRYNQDPKTCRCYLQQMFGGCCGTPGAPC